MGKMLGSYASEELDRPDLNKCPDCGCFFASDTCPLCGKVCPEHMRAGNRKAVKRRKKKRGGSSDRVMFIEWYHQWWFIILAMLFVPLVGIILFATSPYKKSLKIGLVLGAVAWTVLMPILIGALIPAVQRWTDRPVTTNLSKEEYIASCREVEIADFYRRSAQYEDEFVTMTVKVEYSFVGCNEANSIEDTYWFCVDESGGNYAILVRDCQLGDEKNLMSGDVITVWGEGAGTQIIYDCQYYEDLPSMPCLNGAYIELVSES